MRDSYEKEKNCREIIISYITKGTGALMASVLLIYETNVTRYMSRYNTYQAKRNSSSDSRRNYYE